MPEEQTEKSCGSQWGPSMPDPADRLPNLSYGEKACQGGVGKSLVGGALNVPTAHQMQGCLLASATSHPKLLPDACNLLSESADCGQT